MAQPSVAHYRELYDRVGRPWLWYERRLLPDAELARLLAEPDHELHVAYHDAALVGYFELADEAAWERFLAATLELVRRHPQYLSNGQYRAGLSRDIIRNSYLLWREGKRMAVAADLKRATKALGLVSTARLVVSGLAQALLGLHRQRRRRRTTTPVSALSPEVEAALEAARSRELARS